MTKIFPLIFYFTMALYSLLVVTVAKSVTNVMPSNGANVPLNSMSAITQLDLQKVGQAKLSVLFWDIYQSTLYTASGNYPTKSDSEPVLFEINYLRDIDNKDLIARTIEQWQHLGVTVDEYSHYIPLLEAMWPSIKAGDALALFIDKTGSYFYFNNEPIGSINDVFFGQLFIDIWLSEDTSQPALRSKLIGEIQQ